MKYLSILLTVLAAALLLGACMDEEKFDTRAGDRLAFSKDTLRLDTVISGIGTPTAFFMVYNRNDHGVSIADVSFLDGRSQGFRVNVDGMYINDGLSQTIDCPKRDSLRVFVELTPAVNDSDEPVELEAKLLFTLTNGVQQQVVDACDGCLEIPQFGTKHSMNVSVTAGIVIWEFARQFLFSAE